MVDDGPVSAPLPVPSFTGLVTAWTFQPVAVVVAVALAGWYARTVVRVRRAGRAWPAAQVTLFGAGIVALLWGTCGFGGAYLDSLFWVWTAQQLGLLLVVPYLLLAGGPLDLARRLPGTGAWVGRLLASRAVRVLGNPLIGPALVPLLSVALFFGPLPGWAIAAPPVGWVEQVALVAVGALVVLPLTGAGGARSSLAIGLSLAIGSFELVLDAVPGIALRLHRSLSTTYFDHRALHAWTPAALHDQQIAGSVLWCAAELLDLPFLILVYRQWLKADARDAAEIDAVLEAERIARGQVEPAVEGERGPTDQPWWLTDEAMQKRLRRPY